MGVIFVAGMVGFCGSRSLPASAEVSALVSGVVGSVLAGVPRRGVAVGCAVGGDALVVSSALALDASSRLRVFAAFGPVSPPWPAARFLAPGASSSVSSVSGVAAPSPPAPPSPGGPGRSLSPPGRPPRLPLLSTRLGGRRLRSRAAASSASSPRLSRRPRSLSFALGLLLRPGSGSWATLALAVGLGLPVVVFPMPPSSYGPSPDLPAFWPGSWVPLSGVWAGGFRFVPSSCILRKGRAHTRAAQGSLPIASRKPTSGCCSSRNCLGWNEPDLGRLPWLRSVVCCAGSLLMPTTRGSPSGTNISTNNPNSTRLAFTLD